MTRGRQVACLEVDGHLTKELLYRYRRYRLHTNGAGIGRPSCNSSVESDPQRRGEPEDFGPRLVSSKLQVVRAEPARSFEDVQAGIRKEDEPIGLKDSS
jgi:hypothetical protein